MSLAQRGTDIRVLPLQGVKRNPPVDKGQVDPPGLIQQFYADCSKSPGRFRTGSPFLCAGPFFVCIGIACNVAEDLIDRDSSTMSVSTGILSSFASSVTSFMPSPHTYSCGMHGPAVVQGRSIFVQLVKADLLVDLAEGLVGDVGCFLSALPID